MDLASQGINEAQAEILRSHLATFADDWDSPEMSIYDNYDAAKTNFVICQLRMRRTSSGKRD